MNRCFLAAVGLLGFAVPASAATVLEYQATSSQTNPTLAASAVGTGVTGLAFSAGSGISAASSASTWNWRDWGAGSTAYTTAADALSNNDFWTWGFTSTAAYDLTSFDVRLDRSGSGPNQFVLELDVGAGFVSVLSHSFGDSATGVEFLSVDLSSFDAVTSGTFRMIAFGADSGGSSSVGTFDLETIDATTDARSFRLEGELSAAVVPLPAGLPLLGAGLAGLAMVRRRAA